MTKLQQMLLDRYTPKDKKEKMIMLSVGMGANSFGFEDEIIEFLTENPNATLQELDDFAVQFSPEIVEVDDDE